MEHGIDWAHWLHGWTAQHGLVMCAVYRCTHAANHEAFQEHLFALSSTCMRLALFSWSSDMLLGSLNAVTCGRTLPFVDVLMYCGIRVVSTLSMFCVGVKLLWRPCANNMTAWAAAGHP